MRLRTGLGQDSHRFETDDSTKPLVLGGVVFDGHPGLSGNSDADVVLHAITNAVSGVTGVNILGKVSDAMCRAGVTDSRFYLQEALKHLGELRISHVSVSLECARPKISPNIPQMRASIAAIMGIGERDIGITATSGEGLTAFGRGEGVATTVILTAWEPGD
ncbi:MAG: 2-C-methyl-D-erythritol 2,4-cyclodiphosphate synthase [Chromatiales bacterium]|nr:2-C-methyl-D-erythritol 2,4-cyclodiphosphate synthase [Chromatiales bacterium]